MSFILLQKKLRRKKVEFVRIRLRIPGSGSAKIEKKRRGVEDVGTWSRDSSVGLYSRV